MLNTVVTMSKNRETTDAEGQHRILAFYSFRKKKEQRKRVRPPNIKFKKCIDFKT